MSALVKVLLPVISVYGQEINVLPFGRLVSPGDDLVVPVCSGGTIATPAKEVPNQFGGADYLVGFVTCSEASTSKTLLRSTFVDGSGHDACVEGLPVDLGSRNGRRRRRRAARVCVEAGADPSYIADSTLYFKAVSGRAYLTYAFYDNSSSGGAFAVIVASARIVGCNSEPLDLSVGQQLPFTFLACRGKRFAGCSEVFTYLNEDARPKLVTITIKSDCGAGDLCDPTIAILDSFFTGDGCRAGSHAICPATGSAEVSVTFVALTGVPLVFFVYGSNAEGSFEVTSVNCVDATPQDVPVEDVPADSGSTISLSLDLSAGTLNLEAVGYQDCLEGKVSTQPGTLLSYAIPDGVSEIFITTCRGTGNTADTAIAVYLRGQEGTCLASSMAEAGGDQQGCASVRFPVPQRRLTEGRRLQGASVILLVTGTAAVTLTISGVESFCDKIVAGELDVVLGPKDEKKFRAQCQLLGLFNIKVPDLRESTWGWAPPTVLALACLGIGVMLLVAVRSSYRWASRRAMMSSYNSMLPADVVE